MFGFLAPRRSIPEWRRSYARVCQHQRRFFGLTTLPFLSYEAAFLYQLAVDLKLTAPLPESAPQCCRLRRLKSSDPNEDLEVARYAAAFGVLLLGVKLRDDVVDSGRMIARLLEWKYGRQVNRAQQCLPEDVRARVQAAVVEHAVLEQRQERDLEIYAEPTSVGFSAAFAGLPYITEHARDQLRSIGRRVGSAIISWDCAVDYRRDQIKGDYNPLTSPEDVRTAFDHCLLQLAHIGWQLPAGCTTQRVVASVVERVRAARRQTDCDPVERLERWGLVRQRGHAYARCDCLDACCVVGECGDCCGGAAEVGGLCADCGGGGCGWSCGPPHGGCCEGCFFVDACHGSDKKRKTAEAPRPSPVDELSAYSWCHGKSGVTDGALNPAGYVSIDGERVPAKTADGRLLEDGQSVQVTRTDAFGVTVTASSSSS